MDEWLFEYEQLMFGPERTRASMEQAAEMKFAHMPEKVYKYRTFCDNHKQALQDSVLYSSLPTSFNDFIDTNLIISELAKRRMTQKVYDSFREKYGFPKAEVSSNHDFLKIAEEYIRKAAGENIDPMPEAKLITLNQMLDRGRQQIVEERQKQLRSVYSVCCFSANNKSSLMWAHYADSSKGFCVEYAFKKEGIKADNVQLLFPVLYKSDARMLVDDIDETDSSYLMYAATVKDNQWQYEQEWRRFYLGDDVGPKKMPLPTAIYLGTRVKPENEEWMRDFCRDRIELYKMKYDQESNSLVPIAAPAWRRWTMS